MTLIASHDKFRSLDLAIGTEVKNELLAEGINSYDAECSDCNGLGTISGERCVHCDGIGHYLLNIGKGNRTGCA
jgi:hypothetical protein